MVAKGSHLSEETKSQIRNSVNKYYQTPEGIEQKRKNAEFNKTKIILPETGQKISKSNTGKKRSEEQKKNIGNGHRGIKHTEEGKKNISLGHIGIKYPNRKRLSEEDCKKMSLRVLGKHHTEETKKKMSLNHPKKHPHLGNQNGLHRNEEQRKNIAEGHKGLIQTDESKNKHSISSKKAWKKADEEKRLRMLHHPTRVSKAQNELYIFIKQLFPEAILEYPIKTERSYRFADIAIPSLKIDIEYDGYYGIHGHSIENNKKRDTELVNLGWITFRVDPQILKKLYKQKQILLINLKGVNN